MMFQIGGSIEQIGHGIQRINRHRRNIYTRDQANKNGRAGINKSSMMTNIVGNISLNSKLFAALRNHWNALDYQWYRNGIAIPDTNSNIYTVTADDVGTTLECLALDCFVLFPHGNIAIPDNAVYFNGELVYYNGEIVTYTDIPANALYYNGEVVTYNGEILTYG